MLQDAVDVYQSWSYFPFGNVPTSGSWQYRVYRQKHRCCVRCFVNIVLPTMEKSVQHLLFKYAGKINSNNSATLLMKFASEKWSFLQNLGIRITPCQDATLSAFLRRWETAVELIVSPPWLINWIQALGSMSLLGGSIFCKLSCSLLCHNVTRLCDGIRQVWCYHQQQTCSVKHGTTRLWNVANKLCPFVWILNQLQICYRCYV